MRQQQHKTKGKKNKYQALLQFFNFFPQLIDVECGKCSCDLGFR
jgi:hypothetical protein